MADEDQSGSILTRAHRTYSDEERYTALAAVDLNGGNIYRTAKALDIPVGTLQNWVADRTARRARGLGISTTERERRGDLAAKVESLAHTIIESMPGKVAAASLSQSAVAFGIAVDKLRILKAQGLEPDPQAELCALFDLNRDQLPESLQLSPGESVPTEFQALINQPVIETKATGPNAFEPVTPDPEPEENTNLLDSIPDDDKGN